ncbi:hypothetical protein ACJX0J_037991, partial [Zea mays]
VTFHNNILEVVASSSDDTMILVTIDGLDLVFQKINRLRGPNINDLRLRMKLSL